MPKTALPSDLSMEAFATAEDFEAYLEREHTTAPGLYLKLAKKSSGIPSVSAAEAVEVALCFGWIDGWGKGIDDNWYFARYTPRRSRSIWSQKNVATVGRLLEQGRIRPMGLAAVEAAKADGRWDRAYAGPATITMPDDLAAALAADQSASSFYESLNKTDRYAVLWRVQTASPSARTNRIKAIVDMLAVGTCPGRPNKTETRPKKNAISKKSKENKNQIKRPTAMTEPKSKSIPREDEPKRPRRPGLRSRP